MKWGNSLPLMAWMTAIYSKAFPTGWKNDFAQKYACSHSNLNSRLLVSCPQNRIFVPCFQLLMSKSNHNHFIFKGLMIKHDKRLYVYTLLQRVEDTFVRLLQQTTPFKSACGVPIDYDSAIFHQYIDDNPSYSGARI
jgi:hypothetical protein